MLRMKELAMKNEDIAYALVGQAILDEGKVRKVGKNVNAVRKNYRLAELWLASKS